MLGNYLQQTTSAYDICRSNVLLERVRPGSTRLSDLLAGGCYGNFWRWFYRSSLFWVHAVCFYTYFASNVRQLFATDDFSRRHFQKQWASLGGSSWIHPFKRLVSWWLLRNFLAMAHVQFQLTSLKKTFVQMF